MAAIRNEYMATRRADGSGRLGFCHPRTPAHLLSLTWPALWTRSSQCSSESSASAFGGSRMSSSAAGSGRQTPVPQDSHVWLQPLCIFLLLLRCSQKEPEEQTPGPGRGVFNTPACPKAGKQENTTRRVSSAGTYFPSPHFPCHPSPYTTRKSWTSLPNFRHLELVETNFCARMNMTHHSSIRKSPEMFGLER